MVVAGDPSLSLLVGSQGSSIPVLVAFVSGSPQPTNEQITWTVNGAPSSTTGHIFPLSTFISVGDGGVYVCTVTTEREPAVSAQFLLSVNGR